MMRSGARRCLISLDNEGHVNSVERAETGPCGGEKPPGQPGAAVYRHTLDRVNAINDSLKKKKIPGEARTIVLYSQLLPYITGIRFITGKRRTWAFGGFSE